MADVLIQFHAAIDELAEFLRDVTEEFHVHVIALRFHPFSATFVKNDLIDVSIHDPAVREFALTIEPPILPALNATEFLNRNPSALRLDIGRLSEQGLNESCLSARTMDERSIDIWRRVARKLRKITQTGAVATNPATGATSKLRNHRFTAGAKALDVIGIIIRPVAGGSVLHLGE
jgi:hypothetical protein